MNAPPDALARRAARTVLTWGVRGRRQAGSIWGEAVLGEFEAIAGTWAAIRWTASGLRLALRERLRRVTGTRTGRLGLAVVAAMGVLLVLQWVAVSVAYIPSGSMGPTLRIGDRVLIDKVGYRWTGLHRGDLVEFSLPVGSDATPADRFIKRVIGLPGDTISCRGGTVYRDGVALAESYVRTGTRTDCATTTVPPGTVYVLGDDREVSLDSRFFGPVPGTGVIGRVVTRIWPLSGRPG